MGLREEKKQRKRARLESEGLSLFLETGYDRASIEQIASAAGVARGTFYLYFPDKSALFHTLMSRWFEVVMGLLDDVHHQLRTVTTREACLQVYLDMGTGLALVGLANTDEILLAFREARRSGEAGQGLREMELAILDKVTALTQEAVDRGLIEIVNPRLTCTIIFGAVERLFYEAMLDADLGDATEIANETVRIFALGMGLPAR